MTKCYFLGAGASYGYDEQLPKVERPPLTKEFFIKGSRLQLLEKEEYPHLCEAAIEFARVKKIPKPTDLSTLIVDFEKFLSWLASEFYNLLGQKVLEGSGIDFERSHFLQCALGESFYFIFELFRHYSSSYKGRSNCYQRLARSYFAEKFNVITLNYDVLFETAVLGVNGGFHYLSSQKKHESIPIAKIHGSINWLNPFGSMIAYGDLGEEAYKTIVCSIFSNTAWMGKMKTLPLADLKDVGIEDLVRSGTDYDEPALIPPLENYKDYGKVERYIDVWDFAKSMLRDASELVVVGCSIRREDKKLEELLSKSVRKNISVTIVNPQPDDIRDRLTKMLQSPNFKSDFYSFQEYAKRL